MQYGSPHAARLVLVAIVDHEAGLDLRLLELPGKVTSTCWRAKVCAPPGRRLANRTSHMNRHLRFRGARPSVVIEPHAFASSGLELTAGVILALVGWRV